MTEAEQWQKVLGLEGCASSLEVCSAFERLALKLAPRELASVPFYAMPTTALPASWHTSCNFCNGWYHDFSFYWLRPHLPEDRGPGVAVVVKDFRSDEETHNLAKQAQAVYLAEHGKLVPIAEWLECLPNRGAIEVICGTLTHELAHALDAICDPDSWLSAFDGEAERPAIASILTKQFGRLVERAEQQTAYVPQLDCHGLRFTQIVAHLDFRLRQLGVTSHSINVAGKSYKLAPYSECQDALGDQMYRYRNRSFQEILALPNSPKFERCSLNGKPALVAPTNSAAALVGTGAAAEL